MHLPPIENCPLASSSFHTMFLSSNMLPVGQGFNAKRPFLVVRHCSYIFRGLRIKPEPSMTKPCEPCCPWHGYSPGLSPPIVSTHALSSGFRRAPPFKPSIGGTYMLFATFFKYHLNGLHCNFRRNAFRGSRSPSPSSGAGGDANCTSFSYSSIQTAAARNLLRVISDPGAL